MGRPGASRFGLLIIPGSLGAFLLLSSSIDLVPGLGVFNAKRFLQLLLLALVFALALGIGGVRVALSRELRRISRPLAICLCAAFILVFISASRLSQPAYALADVTLLLLLVSGMLIVAACRRAAGEAHDRFALTVIIVLGVIVAIQEFMGLIAGWSRGTEFSYSQMLVRFAHPRFYNQLQSWTLPVLAAVPFVMGGGRRLKIVAALLIGLQWCILLMTGGRGSFLSLTVALLVLALLSPGSRSLWGRIHAGGLLLGLLLYTAILSGHATLAAGEGAFVEQSVGRPMTHSSGRWHLWSVAWREARENPLMGVGPMHFECDGPAHHSAHPHNFLLRILSEWGFPATILLVISCLFPAWALLKRTLRERRQRHESGVLNVMLTGCVLAAALHAMLSGVLIMPASQVMAVFICGWLLGRLPLREPVATPAPFPAVIIAAASLGLAIALTAFSASELRQMEVRTSALAEAGPAHPRYWQHGRVCRYTYP